MKKNIMIEITYFESLYSYLTTKNAHIYR